MARRALLGRPPPPPLPLAFLKPAIEFERAQELEVKPGQAPKNIETTTFLETIKISVKTTHCYHLLFRQIELTQTAFNSACNISRHFDCSELSHSRKEHPKKVLFESTFDQNNGIQFGWCCRTPVTALALCVESFFVFLFVCLVGCLFCVVFFLSKEAGPIELGIAFMICSFLCRRHCFFLSFVFFFEYKPTEQNIDQIRTIQTDLTEKSLNYSLKMKENFSEVSMYRTL